jgi:hypothetical protein
MVISEIFLSELELSHRISEELAAASDVFNAYIFPPMFARRPVARLVAQPSPLGASPQCTRNMATLREIELRLKSVRNIEKITKVSKRPPELNTQIVICCHVLVYENDRVYQARQGTACNAEWEAVRNRKLRYVMSFTRSMVSYASVTL